MENVSILEVWERMGELSEDEVPQVMTKLYLFYEEKLKNEPGHKGALEFFRYLDNAIGQAVECNLNRR